MSMDSTNADAKNATAPPEGERTPVGWAKFWGNEMSQAEKRTRNMRRRGNGIVNRYRGVFGLGGGEYGEAWDVNDDGARPGCPLNYFHTNTNMTKSMLCGQKPQTDVSRRFGDPDDDIARVAAMLMQRILDSENNDSGKKFYDVIGKSLFDRLVPGFGTARVMYDLMTRTVGEGDNETKEFVSEDCREVYVHWQDFQWGWARTWEEAPWIAFRAWMTREEATKRFGDDKAINLEYKNQTPTGNEGPDSASGDDKTGIMKAPVWEIWDARRRKVVWWSRGCDTVLDEKDDPLRLEGFWPCPKPLFANLTTTMLEPTADFLLYQDLYNEIDTLQTRIHMITTAVKVVGVYNKAAGKSVGRMIKEGNENELLPVDNWAMFAEKGGLKGQIDYHPVQDVVSTLATLREVLDRTIQLLHSVTGLSDLMRGANTDQYTSDGTNKMSAKFGSIRIQALQDDFARFASELKALKAEVVAKHYRPQTILQYSNAASIPMADQQYLLPALNLIQSPEVKWRIDIKPESIAMMDYAQMKEERVEFVTAVATYIQSTQAAAREMPGALPAMIEILKWTMAGFKGSEYLEGILDKAIKDLEKNPPGQNDQQNQAEAIKLEIEKLKLQQTQMKIQGEITKLQLKQQGDMQNLQAKLEGEIRKILVDSNADVKLENLDAMNEVRQTMLDHQNTMKEIMASLSADLQREEAQSTYAIAEEQVEHANTMDQLEYQRGTMASGNSGGRLQ